MIFSTHVMDPGTVTSFFKQPLVDTEFDTPKSKTTTVRYAPLTQMFEKMVPETRYTHLGSWFTTSAGE
jgi:hypothetical protein